MALFFEFRSTNIKMSDYMSQAFPLDESQGSILLKQMFNFTIVQTGIESPFTMQTMNIFIFDGAGKVYKSYHLDSSLTTKVIDDAFRSIHAHVQEVPVGMTDSVATEADNQLYSNFNMNLRLDSNSSYREIAALVSPFIRYDRQTNFESVFPSVVLKSPYAFIQYERAYDLNIEGLQFQDVYGSLSFDSVFATGPNSGFNVLCTSSVTNLVTLRTYNGDVCWIHEFNFVEGKISAMRMYVGPLYHALHETSEASFGL